MLYNLFDARSVCLHLYLDIEVLRDTHKERAAWKPKEVRGPAFSASAMYLTLIVFYMYMYCYFLSHFPLFSILYPYSTI